MSEKYEYSGVRSQNESKKVMSSDEYSSLITITHHFKNADY